MKKIHKLLTGFVICAVLLVSAGRALAAVTPDPTPGDASSFSLDTGTGRTDTGAPSAGPSSPTNIIPFFRSLNIRGGLLNDSGNGEPSSTNKVQIFDTSVFKGISDAHGGLINNGCMLDGPGGTCLTGSVGPGGNCGDGTCNVPGEDETSCPTDCLMPKLLITTTGTPAAATIPKGNSASVTRFNFTARDGDITLTSITVKQLAAAAPVAIAGDFTALALFNGATSILSMGYNGSPLEMPLNRTISSGNTLTLDLWAYTASGATTGNKIRFGIENAAAVEMTATNTPEIDPATAFDPIVGLAGNTFLIGGICGDSATDSGNGEQCDDGNSFNTDACTNTCQNARCGDTFIQSGEACDDGNIVNTDTCSACQLPRCGDGYQQSGEACDDGNTSNSDTCLNICQANPGCGFVGTALTNYFPADGNLNDIMGGANAQEANNNMTYAADRNGQVLKAFHFDKNLTPRKRVTSNAKPTGSPNGFSVSAWIKYNDNRTAASGYDGSGSLVASTYRYCSAAGCQLQGWSLGDEYGAGDHFYFSVKGSEAIMGSGNEYAAYANYPNFFSKYGGQWVHVVGVYSPSTSSQNGYVKLYADGAEIASDTTVYPQGSVLVDSTRPLTLGLRADSDTTTQGRWDGEIDEVMIFNKALTYGEVINLAQNLGTGSCLAPRCGDGTRQGVEQCDDGNTINTDACTNSCRTAICGDGIRRTTPTPAEVCDDGNTVNTDTCTNSCLAARCGDGFVQPGEACDDGNTDNLDSCRNTCVLPTCRDGIKDPAEQCDDGNSVNTDACTNSCTANCSIPTSKPMHHWTADNHSVNVIRPADSGYANGFISPANYESGKFGNAFKFSATTNYIKVNHNFAAQTQYPISTFPSTAFTIAYWVKTVGSGQAMLSYATTANDNELLFFDQSNLDIYINNLRVNSLVGPDTNINVKDGQWHHVAASWQSSDGKLVVYKDGAPAFTTTYFKKGVTIGSKGILYIGQEQDSYGGGLQAAQAFIGALDDIRIYDTVLTDGDVFSLSQCNPGTVPYCGDAIKNGSEGCDDGNQSNTDSCTNVCELPKCGDGFVQQPEMCDAGDKNSSTSPDTCRPDCTNPRCGDGVKDSGEQCDDGNTTGNDACTNSCTTPRCGDGICSINGGELASQCPGDCAPIILVSVDEDKVTSNPNILENASYENVTRVRIGAVNPTLGPVYIDKIELELVPHKPDNAGVLGTCEKSDISKYDFSSVRLVFSSGAAATDEGTFDASNRTSLLFNGSPGMKIDNGTIQDLDVRVVPFDDSIPETECFKVKVRNVIAEDTAARVVPETAWPIDANPHRIIEPPASISVAVNTSNSYENSEDAKDVISEGAHNYHTTPITATLTSRSDSGSVSITGFKVRLVGAYDSRTTTTVYGKTCQASANSYDFGSVRVRNDALTELGIAYFGSSEYVVVNLNSPLDVPSTGTNLDFRLYHKTNTPDESNECYRLTIAEVYVTPSGTGVSGSSISPGSFRPHMISCQGAACPIGYNFDLKNLFAGTLLAQVEAPSDIPRTEGNAGGPDSLMRLVYDEPPLQVFDDLHIAGNDDPTDPADNGEEGHLDIHGSLKNTVEGRSVVIYDDLTVLESHLTGRAIGNYTVIRSDSGVSTAYCPEGWTVISCQGRTLSTSPTAALRGVTEITGGCSVDGDSPVQVQAVCYSSQ